MAENKAPTKGDTVVVTSKAQPYQATIVDDRWGKLTVKPLPDQGMTERARAVWRKSVTKAPENG